MATCYWFLDDIVAIVMCFGNTTNVLILSILHWPLDSPMAYLFSSSQLLLILGSYYLTTLLVYSGNRNKEI